MRDPRNRPEDPREAARRELRAGERLVWADRPAPVVARRQHFSRALFGILFTAFACFWVWGASEAVGTSAMGTIFPFFGLPFVIVGVWMLLSPLRAARRVSSTVYAITDRRLFIATGGRSRYVESFSPRDITKIERNDHDNGLGDVIFAEAVSTGGRRNSTHVRDIGFFGIGDAREVEAAVAKLRQSAPAADAEPA